MAVRGIYGPDHNPRPLHECENCEDRGWDQAEAGQWSIAWIVCPICHNRRDRPAPRDGTPVHVPPNGPGSCMPD